MTEYLAHYIWDFLRRHDGERSAAENWQLAEDILRGNRNWLFKFKDFKPFTTL
jgi:hypothetical protein